MMYYNEFAYGIRTLPENKNYRIEFSPRDLLMDENQREVFGDKYTDEIGSLIYDAWPLRKEFVPWEGYEEPVEWTPELLMVAYPTLFSNVEQAREHMYNAIGTEFGWYTDGRRLKLQPCGTPDIFYKGFTTIEEFPAQREFLDTIRNHPRISLGMRLLQEEYEKFALKKKAQETALDEELKKIVEELRKAETLLKSTLEKNH
jgi:hypothetical protein